jgi:hypothetical protein
MLKHLTYLVTVIVLFSSGVLMAQNAPDPNLVSLFGTVELQAGFTPDPFERSIAAGGRFDLSTVGYSGFVGSAPDINLSYTAGTTYDLIIKVRGNNSEDTVLLINAPDGQWYFSDDYEGLNPGIEFPEPQTGLYNIWIGTYSGGTTRATVLITETLRNPGGGGSTPQPTNFTATPNFEAQPISGSVTLNTGFTPDPWEKDILAGGSFNLNQMNFTGYTSNAPDLKLTYTAGTQYKLLIKTLAEDDTVLLIRTPAGTWEYNDDYEGLNAGILFERPISGVYSIWIGKYETGFANAKLIITEITN